MWCTSWTVVVPSATRPASTRPAPARTSVASTGAPDSRDAAADQRMVAVGVDVGAQPGEFVDEPEPGLEQVLGDHGRALGDGVERDELRLQIGGEARVRQRDDVDGLRAAGPC